MAPIILHRRVCLAPSRRWRPYPQVFAMIFLGLGIPKKVAQDQHKPLPLVISAFIVPYELTLVSMILAVNTTSTSKMSRVEILFKIAIYRYRFGTMEHFHQAVAHMDYCIGALSVIQSHEERMRSPESNLPGDSEEDPIEEDLEKHPSQEDPEEDPIKENLEEDPEGDPIEENLTKEELRRLPKIYDSNTGTMEMGPKGREPENVQTQRS
ncbi:hypothetical protein HAX54_010077 [Datura stramonium]|uniref:Uncharacterized protein n=1 Tax=Datura stramonium TaxID=4076 RepID=A0ABS8S018_DATST|nr:hypothetical protein [Datura stramonium]